MGSEGWQDPFPDGASDGEFQQSSPVLAPWMELDSMGLDVAGAAHAQDEDIEADVAGERVPRKSCLRC